LLCGKSIGFFPLKVRPPTAEEIANHSQRKKVRHVIEEWLLVEYACCYLPVQPNAVVERVSKSLTPKLARILGMDQVVPFVTLREMQLALLRRLTYRTVEEILEKCLLLTWQKCQGKV
jgi:hypothetical protein